jgi:hypothetical protein
LSFNRLPNRIDARFLDRIEVSALQQAPADGMKIGQRAVGSSLINRAHAANQLLYHRSISGLRDVSARDATFGACGVFRPAF